MADDLTETVTDPSLEERVAELEALVSQIVAQFATADIHIRGTA